jgi:predicted GIY-YIG superfamily endonuclease
MASESTRTCHVYILAIQREKAIKHDTRDWKINLIERENPRGAPAPLFQSISRLA